MNYDQFSKLWDALVTDRPKSADAVPITNGMSAETETALIEYGKGNKAKILAVKSFLATAHAA